MATAARSRDTATQPEPFEFQALLKRQAAGEFLTDAERAKLSLHSMADEIAARFTRGDLVGNAAVELVVRVHLRGRAPIVALRLLTNGSADAFGLVLLACVAAALGLKMAELPAVDLAGAKALLELEGRARAALKGAPGWFDLPRLRTQILGGDPALFRRCAFLLRSSAVKT